MFPVYPLGPQESMKSTMNTVYKEHYLGEPSPFENSRHEHLRTSARKNCNPLMPFLMTKFPPDFRYVPAHEGVVKQLRKIYHDLVKEALCSTYGKDYGTDSTGIKNLAESDPILSGLDIYKPGHPLDSVTRLSYQGDQIPHQLKGKGKARLPSTCPRRGLMPIMYPQGNAGMESQTEYQVEYMGEKCRKCLGKTDKHAKPKGPPAKEPKLTDDYIPVPMQPVV